MFSPKNFNEDLLGLEGFATKLMRFIEVERHFVPEGLVVALSASFGSGKTTFLEMLYQNLTENKRVVIKLNAWESDYDGDPLFAIVGALLDQTKAGTQEIEQAARSIGAFSLSIANQALAKISGIDLQAAADDANQGEPLTNSEFDRCRARKDELQNLRTRLNDFFSQQNEPVIFVVDELDRCRPDYAISYLEVIKHIFAVDNAVFILAFDRDQLRNSAAHAFGQALDFNEYLRKFIHREVNLPKVDDYTRITEENLSLLLEQTPIRKAAVDGIDGLVSNLSDLFSVLAPTLRQTQEVLRIIAYTLQAEEDETQTVRWQYVVATALLATLKIKHPNWYNKLGNGLITIEEALDLIRMFSPEQTYQWWLSLLVAANALIPNIVKQIEPKLEQLVGKEQLALWYPNDVQAFQQGFGGHRGDRSQLWLITRHIEEVGTILNR